MPAPVWRVEGLAECVLIGAEFHGRLFRVLPEPLARDVDVAKVEAGVFQHVGGNRGDTVEEVALIRIEFGVHVPRLRRRPGLPQGLVSC